MTKASQARALKIANPLLSSYAIADALDMRPEDVRDALRRVSTDPRLRMRPPATRLTAADVERMRHLRQGGYTLPAIGAQWGISPTYAYKLIAGLRLQKAG